MPADLRGLAAGPSGATMLRLAAAQPPDSPLGRCCRQALERHHELVQTVLRRALKRGEVSSDADLTTTAEAVLGVLVVRAPLGAPISSPGDVQTLVELTIDGIRRR